MGSGVQGHRQFFLEAKKRILTLLRASNIYFLILEIMAKVPGSITFKEIHCLHLYMFVFVTYFGPRFFSIVVYF